MIDGRSFFDQQVKNDLRTYDNIQNIATGQRYDYSTECLLDYPDDGHSPDIRKTVVGAFLKNVGWVIRK